MPNFKLQTGVINLVIIIAGVVVLIAIGIFSYFIFINNNKSSQIKKSPSPSAQSTASPKPVNKSVAIQPTISPTLTPTSSPTSSPNSSSNPESPNPSSSSSPQNSPNPGEYNLERSPTDTIVINQGGYVARVLLKDSNGNIVKEQSDFTFTWTIDNPEIIRVTPSQTGNQYNNCIYGINPPCPEADASLYRTTDDAKGHTTLRVKVTKKSENKIVGETSFDVTQQ